MNREPLVSICLPNLNTRPFLEERMESIFAQTLTDWELIICDSFSNDGSWEFFQKFKDDPRVQLHQVPRAGIYAGWNECLRRARGEYIYIATSDDGAQPELLERLLAPLVQFKEIQLACCDFQAIDEVGRPLAPAIHKPTRDFLGEWLEHPCLRNGLTEFLLHATLGHTWFTMNTILFRRKLLESTGLFRTDIGRIGDLAWNLRTCLLSDIAFTPGRWATWRMHPQQATKEKASIGLARDWLECLTTTIHWGDAYIPVAWKTIPHWRQEIIAVYNAEYHDRLGLFLGIAQRSPRQFLSNVFTALRAEPRFLLKQTFHGFRWSAEFSPDRLAAAQRLIALFQSPWPPTLIVAKP